MMNLLEDNQKQQRSTILPFAAGAILLLLTGLLAIFTRVFSPDMLDLWDLPTLLVYIGSFVNRCVLFIFYSLFTYLILFLIEQHLDK